MPAVLNGKFEKWIPIIIFGDCLEELKEMGQAILADKKAMGHPKAKNVVRFVTLWSWRSYEDTYNHEWDSEWELLGLVEPKKVHLMLNEVKKNEK